ncbi:MAG: LD-carboxypeptidase [Bacteroidetes bacterium]|nr:MAG: LD-carboxypeptidase [Bacteroidota bacterium]
MALVRCRPVLPGDLIGVALPSSAPADPERLRAGMDALRRRGYRVELVPESPAPRGYMAGPDRERRDALNHLLRRPDVAAIFCARGGYGALRLLPGLDYEAARRHPKPIVGYSDVTALHLALYARSGLPGVSGPMVAVEWPDIDAATEAQLWALLQGARPAPLLGPRGEALVPVRPGQAEGVLLGGNLAVLTRLIGTPYLPDLTGALLFLEDVGEVPYRIDGLLAHLRLAGLLDRLGGLILGSFTEADPPPDSPSLTLDEVLADYVADLPCPVARGLVYGHFPVKSALPVGVRARLTVTSEAAELTLLEPVVGSDAAP